MSSNDVRRRLHNYRAGQIAFNFERLFYWCYFLSDRRRINREKIKRAIEFFTVYAFKSYKERKCIVEIPEITVDDLKDKKLCENVKKWFVKVIPSVYGNLLSALDIQNLFGKNNDNSTKRNVLRIFEPFVVYIVEAMSAGSKMNKDSILDFQEIIFALIGENKSFKKDVIENTMSLTKFLINYGGAFSTIDDDNNDFEGIRYRASIPSTDFDFLALEYYDVLTMFDIITYRDERFNGITFTGNPVSLDKVFEQSSIVIPINLISSGDLKRILFKYCMNYTRKDRKKLFQLLNSSFFKRSKWNVVVDGGRLDVIVTNSGTKVYVDSTRWLNER